MIRAGLLHGGSIEEEEVGLEKKLKMTNDCFFLHRPTRGARNPFEIVFVLIGLDCSADFE